MPKFKQIDDAQPSNQMVHRLWYYQSSGGRKCVWAITASDNGDYSFGYCDLGFGSPEWGYVSQKELEDMDAHVMDLQDAKFGDIEPYLKSHDIEAIFNRFARVK